MSLSLQKVKSEVGNITPYDTLVKTWPYNNSRQVQLFYNEPRKTFWSILCDSENGYLTNIGIMIGLPKKMV